MRRAVTVKLLSPDPPKPDSVRPGVAARRGFAHNQPMERRPRSRSFTLLEEAGFRLRDYGLAWLAAAACCALFAGLLLLLQRATDGPESYEQAEIVRFGYYDGKWSHLPLVIVRTGDGKVRQLGAPRQALRHCRRGDTIMLVHRGSALFVHPEGCAGAARPH
jgi:hypothetical protein